MIRSPLASLAPLLVAIILAGCGGMSPGGGTTEPVLESSGIAGDVGDPSLPVQMVRFPTPTGENEDR